MRQTQSGYNQEIEAAFPSPRSSHRAVKGTISVTINRDQEKEQVPIVREV